MRENITNLIKNACSVDIDEGRQAYYRYNQMCKRVLEFYPNFSLEQVVSVFVATSPNSSYKGNILSMLRILECKSLEQDINQVKIATYNHCRDRAYSYLNGIDFMESAKGLKIKSFYQNILDPENPVPVTIDGHAHNAWRNELTTMKDVVTKLNTKTYLLIAEGFREVGQELDLIPCQVQAICWFAWKRKHNILALPVQPSLFENTFDRWRIMDTLEEEYAKIKKS